VAEELSGMSPVKTDHGHVLSGALRSGTPSIDGSAATRPLLKRCAALEKESKGESATRKRQPIHGWRFRHPS
jgi:hypothetical protein